MPRSQILSGACKHLDRAQQRGRLDRRRAERDKQETLPPVAKLTAWIVDHIDTRRVEPVETLNVRQYLSDTSDVALEPAERLRRLAMFLEDELVGMSEQPRAWLAVDRIYEAALRIAPSNAAVHDSRAISALSFAELCGGLIQGARRKSAVRRSIMRVAYFSAHEAIRLSAADPDAQYLMGYLLYMDPDHSPGEAIGWFEGALELAPTHGWSRLYRAHCLHDLERWHEAAEAYDAVDPAFLVGHRAWRLEHMLEQRAWCRLKAGDIDAAQAEFDALLARWERNPHLVRDAWGVDIAEAAKGPLKDGLLTRLRALVAREKAKDELSPWPFASLLDSE